MNSPYIEQNKHKYFVPIIQVRTWLEIASANTGVKLILNLKLGANEA